MSIQRHAFLDAQALQIKVKLWRIINQTRRGLRTKDSAMKEAEQLLNWHFDKIIDYTYRVKIRRDLKGVKIKEPPEKEKEMLKKTVVRRKLEDFQKILADAV